jgi:hypothetical protein
MMSNRLFVAAAKRPHHLRRSTCCRSVTLGAMAEMGSPFAKAKTYQPSRKRQ